MRWPWVLVAAGGLVGCGAGASAGPFEGLPLDGDFTVGVSAAVHVARDRTGVAHIYARTPSDAAFVQGYVTAHDRLPQMDLLRRYGAGTLAELYGALDPGVIDSDLEMRMHQMKPLAETTWMALEASRDPAEQPVADALRKFTDGVNRYVEDLGRGLWTIDPALAGSFDPATLAPWSPVDSLIIARYHALSQSWSVPQELDASELYDGLRASYDAADPGNPAMAARHGISRDLLRFAPVGRVSTIAGFPNVATDTGSRSDASDPAPGHGPPAGLPAAASRPRVPAQLFASARSWFGAAVRNGPLGAPGPHSFLAPRAGGTSWAVSAQLTGGPNLLAAELQRELTEPSMFYPIHLIVQGDDDTGPVDDRDLWGFTIPGIPGVMIGENGQLAWSATASEHDVNDIYLEQIVPCGAGSCVAWTDPLGVAHSVPIKSFTEQIKIGTLGAITATMSATYELVPHHGPIIPTIDHTHHTLVPRTGNAALSISYTGYQPSFELRALHNLARARSVADGFRAVADVHYGSQSVMLIDHQRIAWTTHGYIPLRRPAAYGWDPDVHQDSPAPFLVLPGGGAADWTGDALSPRLVPHAIDPPDGYLIAAGADPVGATFDGLPLDQGSVDGQPLYAGVAYTAGLGDERIAARLTELAASAGLSLDAMAAVLRDTHSTVGEKLTPPIVAALDRLDRQNLGPPDVNPYLDGLPPADRTRLATARALLTRWTFATPAATDAPDDDSAATVVFHTWIHFFIQRALADELAAIGFDVWRLDDDQLIRIVYAMLTDPRSFVTSPTTQQPILCDNLTLAGPDDSCTKVILQAMVDAMTQLESQFGTAEVAAWRWGTLHRLAIPALLGPPSSAAGSPRSGDNSSVSASTVAWRDLDDAQRSGGPALRFVAQTTPGAAFIVKWSLPGGVIFDRRSPHDRDLLDGYLSDTLLDAALSIDQIVAAGESRWVFR